MERRMPKDIAAAVTIQLVNLPPGKLLLEVEMYLLDREHHNTYRQWQKQGSPRAPEEAHIRELLLAGELSPNSQFKAFVEQGSASFEVLLSQQSLQLYIVRLFKNRKDDDTYDSQQTAQNLVWRRLQSRSMAQRGLG
ncbi:hypothetical protein [Paenibacillus periandrae]|uniref:hypothetical protein n=1 Tax=Paenibacillus periandrae TaxID=1761741 RepID=UPI001F08DA23|nr:hypothetical protein [Paenibacillus periandrae]